MKTLVDLLEASANTFGNDTALGARMGLRTEEWSYADLWRQVNASAADLRNRFGFRAGDRVLIVGENSPRLVIAFLAAIRARLTLVPLDPFSTIDFMRQVADETQAVGVIGRVGKEPLGGTRHVELDEIRADTTIELGDRPAPEDIVEIVYTSGTTGNPKGVVLTHANIVANVISTSRIISARRRWRMLSILPLSHMFEQTVGTLTPLYLGGTVYYIPALKSSFILRAFQRHRITSMAIVPQVLDLLLRGIERQVEERGRMGLWRLLQSVAKRLPMPARRLLFWQVHKRFGGALTFFVTGGASMNPELANAWERIGVMVLQGYGTTECAPVIAANTLEHRLPDSVGRPIDGVEVRLSEDGEIQIRGASVTQGYWHNPEATRQAFTPDGWYKTGDLGEQNRNGDLFIKGRNKDMIVLPSGLNVFPEDIESVVKAQDGVDDCIVLGLPDSSRDSRVTAVLILDPDTKRSRQEIVQAANQALSPNQRVTNIRSWSQREFPRTRLGKIRRHEIREQLLSSQQPSTDTVRTAAATDPRTDLIQLICRVAGASVDGVTMASDLRLELGLTSLSEVELSVAIEETYGVVIDGSDLAGIRTVGELWAHIEEGKPHAQAPSFPLWALRRPAVTMRRILQYGLLFPLYRLVARPLGVSFLSPLPEQNTPVVFIANHCSHIDTLSIIRAMPPKNRARLSIAAASDYFYANRFVGALASLLLNTFPFSREGAIRASLEYCGDVVDQGWSVLIYPEGTRSTTGKLLPFRRGIGLLTAGLRVPVVPVAVHGGYEILPKGKSRPRPGPVEIVFGEPMQVGPKEDPDELTARFQEGLKRLLETDPGR